MVILEKLPVDEERMKKGLNELLKSKVNNILERVGIK